MIDYRAKLFGSIVTFNPDIQVFEKNIQAIRSQINLIVIVDNNSKNINAINEIALRYKCELIYNESNMGIATALNQASAFGLSSGFEWMLALDQDSECPPTFCKILSSYFDNPRIGIVAPVIQDRDSGIIGHNPKGEYRKVRTCITSGSCTRLSAWEAVNGYDERMFIDSVDFDFCYRLRKAGYEVIQTSDVTLLHSLGEFKRTKLLKIHYSEHSAFRYYYMSRNNIFYPKKNRLYIFVLRGFLRNVSLFFRILCLEENKKGKLLSVLKGCVDGIKMPIEKKD